MSSEQAPCSVGLHSGETCHKLSYTKQIGHRVSTELSDVKRDLILWRTNLPLPRPEGFTICDHHEKTVLVKYRMLALKERVVIHSTWRDIQQEDL